MNDQFPPQNGKEMGGGGLWSKSAESCQKVND